MIIFTGETKAASKAFVLLEGLESEPILERNYLDFATYLYSCKLVKYHMGRVLVLTDPAENGGHVISPGFSNGFVGAIFTAYNEHRHLILRPDDVWLAITTAFGVFMGVKENAETMRKQFVDFEGKMQLEVEDPLASSILQVNWTAMIDTMSDLIEKHTKRDARTWMEPDFSTTTPVCKTVGQVVLMGAMKHYFEFCFSCGCGLPKVTLEGTLDDWKKVQEKARHLASFEMECLTHWSGLLEIVLQKMVDSYEGKVDVEFWSHVVAKEEWGSGPQYIAGWINVFMPFCEKGIYKLHDVKPESYDWGKTPKADVPPSTVEVPVTLDDNGRKYETIFYSGHIVCLYNPDDDSIRPSLDWAIVDITDNTGMADSRELQFNALRQRGNYRPETFAKPIKFSYGG